MLFWMMVRRKKHETRASSEQHRKTKELINFASPLSCCCVVCRCSAPFFFLPISLHDALEELEKAAQRNNNTHAHTDTHTENTAKTGEGDGGCTVVAR